MSESVRRYFRQDYTNNDTVYDVIWWDAKTGEVVLRYDGADPANTDERYGATPDDMIFARKGLDFKERIAVADQTFTRNDAFVRLYGREPAL